MRRVLIGALIALGLLAGCGLDGPPKRPPAEAAPPSSVTITGSGYGGVAGSR